MAVPAAAPPPPAPLGPSTPWGRLKQTGLPALALLLSFLWLALSCAVLQACVLPLLLFGRRKEYYLASRMIFTLLHRPLVYLFQYSGSKVFVHGVGVEEQVLDKIGRDQAIILVNHRGDLDWLVGLLVLDSGGGMGCCKAMIKRSLLMVPFLGFIWWGVDFVCLRRNWAKDEITLQESYKGQHRYRECEVPYALTIFPEGTRLTPKKLADSQAFAKSRNLPVFEHVLFPRTKGLWSAMNGLRLDSVFDATLVQGTGGSGGQANVATLARGVPCELHVHMERVTPSDIPRDEEALGRWLVERWEMKERRLTSFGRHGHFDGSGGSAAVDSKVAAQASQPRELKVRPSAGRTTLGALIWWFLCMATFVRWCISRGRFRLLGGCTFGFVLLIALLGLALQAVHFKKEPSVSAEKSKAA